MALYRLPAVHLHDLQRVQRRTERIFRHEIDVLLYYSDEELVRHYHFGRRTIRHMTRLVEDEIGPATNRTHPFSATTQVLITLS